MKTKIIAKSEVPKKIPRCEFRNLRGDIDEKVADMERMLGNPKDFALLIEDLPKEMLHATRRWYISHGYPKTFAKKGKLYIQR